tara:strand:+ start:226 stop:498 length:273 start_codon:yes stop_codon:yes gene_type:complete
MLRAIYARKGLSKFDRFRMLSLPAPLEFFQLLPENWQIYRDDIFILAGVLRVLENILSSVHLRSPSRDSALGSFGVCVCGDDEPNPMDDI